MPSSTRPAASDSVSSHGPVAVDSIRRGTPDWRIRTRPDAVDTMFTNMKNTRVPGAEYAMPVRAAAVGWVTWPMLTGGVAVDAADVASRSAVAGLTFPSVMS